MVIEDKHLDLLVDLDPQIPAAIRVQHLGQLGMQQLLLHRWSDDVGVTRPDLAGLDLLERPDPFQRVPAEPPIDLADEVVEGRQPVLQRRDRRAVTAAVQVPDRRRINRGARGSRLHENRRPERRGNRGRPEASQRAPGSVHHRYHASWTLIVGLWLSRYGAFYCPALGLPDALVPIPRGLPGVSWRTGVGQGGMGIYSAVVQLHI